MEQIKPNADGTCSFDECPQYWARPFRGFCRALDGDAVYKCDYFIGICPLAYKLFLEVALAIKETQSATSSGEWEVRWSEVLVKYDAVRDLVEVSDE